MLPDQVAVGVVAQPREQVDVPAEPAEPERHVRGAAAGVLRAGAVRPGDDVDQRLADDEGPVRRAHQDSSSSVAVAALRVSRTALSRSRAPSSHSWHRAASASPRSQRVSDSSSVAAPASSRATTATSSSRACS